MRKIACVLFLLFLVFLHIACSRNEREPATEMEIVVASAANLTDAFEEMGRRFTSKTGIRVVNSFGATADLTKQIENGAPFDVFAAADVKHVEGLEKKNLLAEGSLAKYARGKLVLWIPHTNSPITTVEQIANSNDLRVSVAKPELAPYGAAAVESLRALGMWEKVEPKVVYAQNVSQAKQYAATGNAEAAFLPRSLVKENDGRVIAIDSKLHQPIDQALGIMAASKKHAAAKRFREFVLSEEGQVLLESFGYERVN